MVLPSKAPNKSHGQAVADGRRLNSYQYLNMMIKIILKIFACAAGISWIAVSPGFSQPGWLKEALRDKNTAIPHEQASALILYHTAEIEISPGDRAHTHVRKTVKILKPSGEDLGVLSEAVAPFRKINDLKGWLFLPDGGTRTLSKEHIVEIGAKGMSAYYDDSRTLVASFAEIKTGTVAAFEYDIEENDYTSFFQSFVFQKQQPVKFAQVSVVLPEGWHLNKAEWRADGIVYERQGNRHVWTANDLAYQPEEPLMPPWGFLSRRVAFTCYSASDSKSTQFADWQAVARWCDEIHRASAVPDETVATRAKQLAQGFVTPAEKVQAVAAFVRDEIRYVAVEIDKGRWEPRLAATTLYNRYGDCKDKTALMRALLQALNIPSVPVMANTGFAVQPALPTPFQFNHCIVGISVEHLPELAQVSTASSQGWLFFDPTDPSRRLGELPTPLQGGSVLLATPAASELYRLPHRAPEDFRRRFRAEAYLNSDGSLTAEIAITDFKNWAAESRYLRQITPADKQIEEWRALLSQTVPNLALSNYQTGFRGDSSWVSFQLQGPRYLTQVGALHLLKADLFHAAEPAALTAKERHHPIWHGPARQIETEVVWHLPTGWKAEAPVAPLKSTCGVANLSCETILSGNTIKFVLVSQQSGRLLPPENYDAARKFSQDVSMVKGLTFILKKP
jgi:hypothetical protein